MSSLPTTRPFAVDQRAVGLAGEEQLREAGHDARVERAR